LLVLLLLLSISPDSVSNLSLLLFLIDREALLHIILQLSALFGWQLIEFKLKYLPSIGGETILHQVNDPPLLFLSEHADTVFELVFLVDVHGLLRDRALLS
jgi:hypothetical protein